MQTIDRTRAVVTMVLVLAYLLTGRVRAQGMLYAVDDREYTLVMFDPITLERTVVGPLGTGFGSGDLAWDHVARVMYMVDGGEERDALFAVDIQTGAALVVGEHGVPFLLGMEWDPTVGTLYATVGARGTGFYELDPMTAEATFIGDPRQSFATLAWDTASERLVGAISIQSEFWEIDRATGQKVFLSFSDYFDDCGMKYDRDRDVFWMIDHGGNIYRYDPHTFEREHLASGLGDHDGMVYVPDFTTLTISGECPGQITAEVTEATPGGRVALAYAFGEDNRELPVGGPCAGTWIRLDETAQLLAIRRADSSGRVTFTRHAPPAACGVSLQAIDLAACAVTDVGTL